MASSSSSVSSLSGFLCSTLCSRGTSSARILRYAAGCVRRTFAMAFSPCVEKSLSNAQITASLSRLREPRSLPAGLPTSQAHCSLLCCALHRAAPLRCAAPCQSRSRTTWPPSRYPHFRKLLSHLPLGRAAYLRPAELHALSNRSLEAGFDSLANHRPLKLSERAGSLANELAHSALSCRWPARLVTSPLRMLR